MNESWLRGCVCGNFGSKLDGGSASGMADADAGRVGELRTWLRCAKVGREPSVKGSRSTCVPDGV